MTKPKVESLFEQTVRRIQNKDCQHDEIQRYVLTLADKDGHESEADIWECVVCGQEFYPTDLLDEEDE